MQGVVVQTDPHLDNMVEHLGYVSLKQGSPLLEGVVKTDRQLLKDMADRLAQTEVIADHALNPIERNHLELARAITRGFDKTGPVYAANIPPASSMVSRTAGTYQFRGGRINIDRPELEHAGTTVAVVNHELGHHLAYQETGSPERAEDLTPEHAKAMGKVTDLIFRNLAQGKYDEQLKSAIW
jgi:hypothetical protein